jgi:hypothetical protein
MVGEILIILMEVYSPKTHMLQRYMAVQLPLRILTLSHVNVEVDVGILTQVAQEVQLVFQQGIACIFRLSYLQEEFNHQEMKIYQSNL